MNEMAVFVTKARRSGGSLELTLDSKVAEYEGIKEGDLIKVMIKKLPTMKLEE